MQNYPSDLTNTQWQLLQPHMPILKPSPARKWDLRTIYNAIIYVMRTGCAWRMLPRDFPAWQTVYGYFRTWVEHGLWETLNDVLRETLRVAHGKNLQPSACSFDAQSVKTGSNGGIRGYDGHKKVNGRKRFLLVDTLGLVMRVQITPADTKDTDGAMDLLQGAQLEFPRVKLAWADQGFRWWVFESWMLGALKWKLELTSGLGKPGDTGFVVAPRRWVVERTFGWLMRFRRLGRDFEVIPWVSACAIYACMGYLMLRRLDKMRLGAN